MKQKQRNTCLYLHIFTKFRFTLSFFYLQILVQFTMYMIERGPVYLHVHVSDM